MKVAIVHDWLVGMRGGERCLEILLGLYPDADIFTLFYRPEQITPIINARRVAASVLNTLPGSHRYYRGLLPFFALGVADLNRKIASRSREQGYELLISISHCVAKNVSAPAGCAHLCYCLTPVRYLWDQYDSYFAGHRLEPFIRPIASRLRQTDVARAASVDRYVAISEFVRARISRIYGRDADVVYPPVDSAWIQPRRALASGDRYLMVNALVPYKNTAAVIEAFNRLRLPLDIVGTGPEEPMLRRLAGPHITFHGRLDEAALSGMYARSAALIYAACEDFGMVPVEMLASGGPVICLGKGGVTESVSPEGRSPTGLYFDTAEPEAIISAVERFRASRERFTPESCIHASRRFTPERFIADFKKAVNSVYCVRGDVGNWG